MFAMVNENARQVVSAVAAVAVVAFGGFALDQGHVGSLPEGVVEVGQMTPVNLMQLASVELPEVVVSGARIDAPLAMLPEIEVVAARDVRVAEAVALESGHSRT